MSSIDDFLCLPTVNSITFLSEPGVLAAGGEVDEEGEQYHDGHHAEVEEQVHPEEVWHELFVLEEGQGEGVGAVAADCHEAQGEQDQEHLEEADIKVLAILVLGVPDVHRAGSNLLTSAPTVLCWIG